MSRAREEFEAWISSPPYEREVERFGDGSAWPGSYREIDVDLAWCSWSASRSALAAPAERGVQWQPIETAPKDGTEVLLFAPGRRTYGAWVKPSDKPQIKYRDGFAPEPEWEEFEPYWASWDGGFTAENPPTHWAQAPDAPGGGIGTEGGAQADGAQGSER